MEMRRTSSHDVLLVYEDYILLNDVIVSRERWKKVESVNGSVNEIVHENMNRNIHQVVAE